MPTALDVTIDNGTTTYALQVEEFTVNIRRSPLQAPMPGADPVQVDLGFFDPSISLRGVIPVSDDPVDGDIATKAELEAAVIASAWYGATITIKIISTSENYVGKIAGFKASLKSGKEGLYWDYTLDFLAKAVS